jgi:RNA polymerase sigma-70 factor (ECF subfamily)
LVDERWSAIWVHHDDLLRLARRRVLNDLDAEDVVHEAMALAAADDRIELGRAGAWMNRVVRNRCADLARERSYADKCVIYEEGRVRVQPLTEDIVCDSAEATFLSEMLQTLPSRQHEALVHASHGLSNAQIAMAMSTTVKAIESLLVKARRALRTAAAAVVVGFGYLVRRSSRPATSSAGLVALTVGLSVYAFSPATPVPGAAHTGAPHLALQPDVTTTRVAAPPGRARSGLAADVSRSTTRTRTAVSHAPAGARPHTPHPSVHVKAGPSDSKVNVSQHGSPMHPIASTIACVQSGIVVSLAYNGCANAR